MSRSRRGAGAAADTAILRRALPLGPVYFTANPLFRPIVMRFHLPRRYRRPLLFPPGLLALAWLLWLGCVALGPWQEQLKLRTMLRLTMPPLPSAIPPVLPSDSIPPPPPPPYLTRAELNELLPWRDAYFNGNSQSDGHEKIRITSAVHDMMSNTEIGSGVRIQFMPKSYYKDLVFVINLMSQEGVRRWFLDTRQKPTVF